jgi:hypothetical protein
MMRVWFAPLTVDGKLPCTGIGIDAVKYSLGKDYRPPVGTVTAQTMDMVQRLAQSEEVELTRLRPGLLAGGLSALRDAMGSNPYRRQVPEIQTALGKWLAERLGSPDHSFKRDLEEVHKSLHPPHEADHRFICGRIGEYFYQGFSRNYGREDGEAWDPKDRCYDTLKRHDDEARRRFRPQIRTFAWLHVKANATAPHTQIQPSRQQVDSPQRPE